MRTLDDLCLRGGEWGGGEIVKIFRSSLFTGPTEVTKGPNVNPGGQVYAKCSPKKGIFKQIWKGPHIVLLVASVAVRVNDMSN